MHSGHQQIDAKYLSPKTVEMNEEEETVWQLCKDSGLPDTYAANLLSMVAGNHWKPEQLRYLDKREKQLVSNLSPDASSADQLVQAFKQWYVYCGKYYIICDVILYYIFLCCHLTSGHSDDVSFIMVTHHPESGLLVVTKDGSKRLQPSDFGDDFNPTAICEELKVGAGKRLLLIFMWVTDEELWLFHMFPEVLAWDVTKKVCKEKRPLWCGCGKDGNNQIFHCCHAFLPSEKRWVFCCLYRYCCPALLGKTILERNYLSLTDGDADEYLAFIDAVKVGFNHSSVVLCSCAFPAAPIHVFPPTTCSNYRQMFFPIRCLDFVSFIYLFRDGKDVSVPSRQRTVATKKT